MQSDAMVFASVSSIMLYNLDIDICVYHLFLYSLLFSVHGLFL